MIVAKHVEEGGVEVTDVDGIFGDLVAERISFSVGVSFFDSCACHPDGEGVWVVVASGKVSFTAVAVFLHWCSAKFSAPDYEGVF